MTHHLHEYTSADLGGACPAYAPPYGTQFFRFRIHFHRKVPTSEVHVPLTGAHPPTGNPGSATDIDTCRLISNRSSSASPVSSTLCKTKPYDWPTFFLYPPSSLVCRDLIRRRRVRTLARR